MQCAHVQEHGGRIHSCGRCMPCRINKKRMWAGRIMLEAAHSPCTSTFLTMTYDDANIPENGSISVSEVQRYIDRLRKTSGMGSFRYFACGEYGDNTDRPHYHMAIFNHSPEAWEEVFQDKWEKGFTKAGEISRQSASYIAGYVTKKLVQRERTKPDGRRNEFSLMSKQPPLGKAGINHIYDLLHTRTGAQAVRTRGDVPGAFNLGGTTYPLGDYWKKYLRKQMGITNPPVQSTWELNYEQFTKEAENAEKKATKLWQSARFDRSRRKF